MSFCYGFSLIFFGMHKTADLYDQFSQEIQVLEPIFLDLGGLSTFEGEIVTLKVFEDNSLVRQTLESPGEGRILVVDGGASLRCALLGDKLGTLAEQNDWVGIVIYGCVRDSAELAQMGLGIRALNTTPAKSIKRNEGQKEIPLHFAGVRFKPGDYLYADEDGMVLAEKKLL